MRGNASTAVYVDDVLPPKGVEDVTPPREARTTDLSKTFLTLPVVIAIISSVVTGVASAGVAGWAYSTGIREVLSATQSDIRDIRTSMSYERQAKEKESENLELRFKMLEAQIESAGLRNAAMSMAQELQKLQKGQ